MNINDKKEMSKKGGQKCLGYRTGGGHDTGH